MTISRWKVMAGVLGVSLGGLAAIAGQCQKPDALTTHRSAEPPTLPDVPKVPAGGGSAAKPVAPVAPTKPQFDLSALPPGDLLVPTAGPAPKLPVIPPPAAAQAPKAVDLTILPPAADPATVPPPPPIPAKVELPKPEVIPTAAFAPVLPTPAVNEPARPVVVEVPAPAKPIVELPSPAKTAPVEFTSKPAAPATPAVPPSTRPVPPAGVVEAVPHAPEAGIEVAPVKATTAAVSLATKFRIVLRVGEGEPMFEVRHGDDLVMKVACEKVDIKSPEKGQGMSNVVATGKVRFVGFGAEGTCDSFSFLAGTGEVAMAGNVKVQVKDKIGRVESELTSDKLQYRLDSHAMPGMLKP